uniref:MOSC domain-containing protein n=1 Tax=Rhodosorus marinus TaxID=101924 RepID=A0A7S0BGX3_9RHOD
MRSGCMCSPGACHRLLGLSSEDIQAQFEAGHVCGDEKDIVKGMRTGAVRVSFGLASTMDDVNRLAAFLRDHFLSDANEVSANPSVRVEEIQVKRIVVYPVKGLGGMDVDQWKIGPDGLSQDRRFSVIELGVKRAISLKRNPRMAFVEAEIDPAGTSLTLKVSDAVAANVGFAAGEESISVPLEENSAQENREIRVCGRMEQVRDAGLPSSWEWLSRVLKADVRIVEGVSQMQNEEALLVVSRATLTSLNRKLLKDGKLPAEEDVFRGNVYVETSPDASADFTGRFGVGELTIANVKPCVRCMAVNVDGSKGTSREDSEPLRTLARERYTQDHKVVFGDLFAVSCPGGTSMSSGAVFKRLHI